MVKTGSPDEAEDLTQDVLIRVRARWHQFEGRSSVRSWVYRILHHAFLDRCRSRDARRRAEEAGSDGLPRARRPTDHADSGLTDLVRGFLDRLSERQREVVNLVDLEGFEPAEVADMVDLDRSTVRVHLHRGRKALREMISEVWER